MELDDGPASAKARELSPRLAGNGETGLERASRLALAGELVAAVTHDLRQPLTAVEMNVSAATAFLRRSPPAIGEALAALDDALAQERRMRDALQVLQDLVVHRDPRHEPCDVNAAVRDVVTLVQGYALARHVRIELDAPETLPAVLGDPVLIRQALLNVLANALEATSLGGGNALAVRISMRRRGETVEIDVRHVGHPTSARHAALDDWSLALARSVVAAHGATMAVTGNEEMEMSVLTTWPVHAS
ncbi:MAG: hypothetical protein ACREPM_23350 [Gemmatimonadaceae bacterium]